MGADRYRPLLDTDGGGSGSLVSPFPFPHLNSCYIIYTCAASEDGVHLQSLRSIQYPCNTSRLPSHTL